MVLAMEVWRQMGSIRRDDVDVVNELLPLMSPVMDVRLHTCCFGKRT